MIAHCNLNQEGLDKDVCSLIWFLAFRRQNPYFVLLLILEDLSLFFFFHHAEIKRHSGLKRVLHQEARLVLHTFFLPFCLSKDMSSVAVVNMYCKNAGCSAPTTY